MDNRTSDFERTTGFKLAIDLSDYITSASETASELSKAGVAARDLDAAVHTVAKLAADTEGQQLVQDILERKKAENEAHYFKFSTNWQAGKRLCGSCKMTYDHGKHLEVNNLKPFTNYVCSTGGGYGHSGVWTGDRSRHPELNSPRDAYCICGEKLVEVDKEEWKLSWEMIDPFTGGWKKVKVIRNRHDSHRQHEGLQQLLATGEVRNIKLKRKGKK